MSFVVFLQPAFAARLFVGSVMLVRVSLRLRFASCLLVLAPYGACVASLLLLVVLLVVVPRCFFSPWPFFCYFNGFSVLCFPVLSLPFVQVRGNTA